VIRQLNSVAEPDLEPHHIDGCSGYDLSIKQTKILKTRKSLPNCEAF
jgi:hypothetical protein